MKLFVGIVAAGLWAVNRASVLSNEADWRSSQGALSACDSFAAREALNDAVENNASSNLQTLRLLDVTNVQEIASQTSSDIRLCNATLVLNSGAERIGYQLSVASDGYLLVEIGPIHK